MATPAVSLIPEARPEVEVNISDIVFLSNIYPRGQHKPALVQEYESALNLMPPIMLNQDGILIDGYHRYLAHKAAGRLTIKAVIVQTKDEDEAYLLSNELNCKHGDKLSLSDKRRNALRMYSMGLDRAEIMRRLSVAPSSLSEWFKDKEKIRREELKKRILDLWLACFTAQEIADQIGSTLQPVQDQIEKFRACDSDLKKNRKVSFSEEGWKTPLYNVWRFAECSNEVAIFGKSEQTILENCLYLYTDPLDIVVDVFGGAGSTVDVCIKRGRRYWCSDLNPIVERSHQIRKMDALKELPPLHNRWSEVSLTYLDPPYWRQAQGKYSDDPEDLSNMSLQDFNDSFSGLVRRIAEKQTHGNICLLISPTQYVADNRQVVDHAFDLRKLIEKSKNLRFENRVSCPWPSQQYKEPCVTWAKENRQLLVLNRELLIWKIV